MAEGDNWGGFALENVAIVKEMAPNFAQILLYMKRLFRWLSIQIEVIIVKRLCQFAFNFQQERRVIWQSMYTTKVET